MATEVKLPTLGENVDEAEVLAVLVAAGDHVSKDQALLEVETDKATVEVPAPMAGVVEELRVRPGDRIQTGQVIVLLAGDGERGAERSEERREARTESKRPRAKAREARRDEGEARRPAPEREERERPREPASGERERAPEPPAREERHAPAAAAPSVRRLARELGIDVEEVPAEQTDGRISADDVKRHARALLARGGGAPAAAPPLPDFTRWGEVERQAMSGIRRHTAAAMARSWSEIPHVTQFDRADITALERARKQYAGRVAEAGGKLTVSAIVIKVAASALKVFPKFNASLDLEREEIVYKRYEHVGVAVDTEHGLLVPVVRDASHKNVIEIAVDLATLSEKARARKLSPDEVAGATFTITNLGGLGTTYFSPLVNWPQVAVLGIGRASLEAVHVDGAFVPRLLLPLSVSYDHRIIDGADAARFLRWIAEALEQPFILAIEG